MDYTTTTPLRVEAWPDPVIDRLGHAPNSSYFEWLWVPRIGPSAGWAYRRLTSGLKAQPGGYDIALSELAHWLGLGTGSGRNAPMIRTLGRLTMFQLAQRVDGSTLAVRRMAPPLTRAQLLRLSPHLQRTHLRLSGIASPPGADAEAS